MWLPDERYTTLVGFVVGCCAATDRDLLNDFGQWLTVQYDAKPINFVWWAKVGRPEDRDPPRTRTYYGDLDEAVSVPLNNELFDRLLEFLSIVTPPNRL
jgi:hypothetical protein